MVDGLVVSRCRVSPVAGEFLRDLRGVMEREKAEIGMLLSFDKPTKKMRTEAATGRVLRVTVGQASPDTTPDRGRAAGWQEDRLSTLQAGEPHVQEGGRQKPKKHEGQHGLGLD